MGMEVADLIPCLYFLRFPVGHAVGGDLRAGQALISTVAPRRCRLARSRASVTVCWCSGQPWNASRPPLSSRPLSRSPNCRDRRDQGTHNGLGTPEAAGTEKAYPTYSFVTQGYVAW